MAAAHENGVSHSGGKRHALLIIDMQNDFCPPTGSLQVSGGLEVLKKCNEVRSARKWDLVVLTKDWHPSNHTSFLSNNIKRDPEAKLFNSIKLPTGYDQVMWPDHCVQGSKGSDIHPDLTVEATDKIVYKGKDPNVDSYSGFYDNDHATKSEMEDILREAKITDVTLCGLAYDYCVGYSALDAKNAGFNTSVVHDAAAGVAPDTTSSMIEQLKKEGIAIVQAAEL